MIFNKIPILILCYNKLRSLKKLIAITQKYKYFNLYISLDGPISKKDKHNLEVLKYINSLKKNKKYKIRINKYNKGCKLAVSEAISWFFKHQRKGIILEEDCLPNKSFFKFCLQGKRNNCSLIAQNWPFMVKAKLILCPWSEYSLSCQESPDRECKNMLFFALKD